MTLFSVMFPGCSAIMPSHLLLLGLLIMPGFTSGATSTAPTSTVTMVATSTPATTQPVSSTTSRGTTMSSASMPTSTVTSNTGAPMTPVPTSTPLIPTGSSSNIMQSSSSSSGSTLPTATTTQTTTSTPLSTGSATTNMQWPTMSTNPASGGATTTAAASQTPTSTPLSTGSATTNMQWSTSGTNPASEGPTTTAASTQTPTSSPLSTGSATGTMQPMSGGTTAAAMPKSTATMANAASPSSVSSNTDSWTSMKSTTQTTASSDNMTSMMTTAMSLIYCPEFSCNYSDCNTMYASQNMTPCAAGQWCKLCKMDMYYMAGCSSSCNDSCMSDSQTNCSVACCNYTGCLNSTFASMVMMPSAAASTAAPVTTAMANPQPTTSDNGNKCNEGTCTGATCYTSFSSTLQTCSSSDLHCQLKKETVGSDLRWTAGCAANCSSETMCTPTTQPPCHLECCNVTVTSCLWLNGTVNFQSSAGRIFHAEQLASLLCWLVALGFLL
uniref:mucin-5AC isoform X3 n=1 Tax=Doryrhamphus excisus TaxID=161450 RepID=UPI0025ADD557|nr:mucin-5AC isoform X3 [Doryrhamphus excisus]